MSVLGVYMDSLSICRIKNNIIIRSNYLLSNNYDAEEVQRLINDIIKNGFHRINLIIVNDCNTSFGGIIKVLGMELKRVLFPSISLWVVKEFRDADTIIKLDLGGLYGEGI